MTNIYILKLENDNYYVGKSNDVLSRYRQHLSGNGSSWINKNNSKFKCF